MVQRRQVSKKRMWENEEKDGRSQRRGFAN
jgi:hypothetical protein